MIVLVKAAKKQDVAPGSGIVAECGGKPIAVFNVGGQFYAIQNTCPHRGGPLGTGEIEGSVVTCPWHAWRFDVRTGLNPDNPKSKVASYPIQIEADNLLVEVDG